MVEINQEVKNMRGERIEAIVMGVLRDLDKQYKDKTMKLEELSDDQLYALHLLQYDDASKITPRIDKLKTDYIMNEMKAIENDRSSYVKKNHALKGGVNSNRMRGKILRGLGEGGV